MCMQLCILVNWFSGFLSLQIIGADTEFPPEHIPPELDRDAFWSHLPQYQRHGECQQYSTWTWYRGQDTFQFLLLVVC